MTIANCTVAPIKPSVSASIIFPPRQLKHYQRWQRLCTTLSPAQQGLVPSALEYENFQQWLKRQDSGYFSDHFEDLSEHVKPLLQDSTVSQVEPPVAVVCQHRLHPVAVGQSWLRCPVCTIDMHIRYLRVLKRALDSAGGRAPTCTLMTSEFQEDVYSAWLYAKICAVQEYLRLERMAEQEADWDIRHSRVQGKDLQTAEKALQLYWSEIGGCDADRSSRRGKKTVAFSEQTSFELGRPCAYFWQKSPRYEHGKYTLSKEDREEAHISPDESEPTGHAQTDCAQRSIVDDQATVGVDASCDDAAESFLEDDDDDSDWEDVESNEDADLSYFEDSDLDDGSILFEAEEQTEFIVFEDD